MTGVVTLEELEARKSTLFGKIWSGALTADEAQELDQISSQLDNYAVDSPSTFLTSW